MEWDRQVLEYVTEADYISLHTQYNRRKLLHFLEKSYTFLQKPPVITPLTNKYP
jgi:hypothetical protein